MSVPSGEVRWSSRWQAQGWSLRECVSQKRSPFRWWAPLVLIGLPAVQAAPLHAQPVATILGRITDVVTGDPIEGAEVSITGADLHVVSGSEGWYFLTGLPVGGVEVRVERLGYALLTEPLQLSGDEVLTLDFQLRPEAIPLEELVVTAQASPGRSLGHRTVIGREQIAKRKVGTVTELLQGLVPGVYLNSSSGQVGEAPQIRIRGIRSLQEAYPLFFIDGVKVGSARTVAPPGTGEILDFLNVMSPQDIERIEVVRNPEATLLYGAEARGGVILIFTKRGGRTGGRAPGVPV